MKTQTLYDPGTPGEVIPEGNGRYIIESFREEGVHYTVDTAEGTCSCPDHILRGGKICKHLSLARELERIEADQAAKAAKRETYLKALEIARSLPVQELIRHSKRTDLAPEKMSAIQQVLKIRYF